MKKSLLLISSLILASCNSENLQKFETNDNQQNESIDAHVVYGIDDRIDYHQASEQLKKLANSTVALVKTNQLSKQGESFIIAAKNYGQEMRLCSSERFRDQDTAAFCSGFLVAPDTIVTAGHCIKNQNDCEETSFIFGFTLKTSNPLPNQIAFQDVFRCRSIVQQVLTSQAADFAVIKLDRAVSHYPPLNIRRSGEITVGEQLIVIGHPSGLPTKITAGGRVRSTSHADYFVANTDTYGGNSGSAVFNAKTGLIEGILVRGEQDFAPSGNCYVSKNCQEEFCRGEDITRISLVAPVIPLPPPTTHPDQPDTQLKSEKFMQTTNLNIPDNNLTGVKTEIKTTTAPEGRKILVSINIVHTYKGDLIVKLTAPDGQIITLHNRTGGSADHLKQTFDLTSRLNNLKIPGKFTLSVSDVASQDKGQIKDWSITFEK